MTQSSSFTSFVFTVCAAFAFVLAGCGAVVTPQGDGGSDAVEIGAMLCGIQPSDRCAYGSAGGACGDVEVPQVCDGGAWHCPSGTVPMSQCRCFGRPPTNCTCSTSGWQCPVDAGVDAPIDCPADPSAALGTPCSEEGRTCGGPCTDHCAFCNIIRCQSGRWVGLEVFPDPTCTTTFACGPMRCTRTSQYCSVILDDTGGPNFYQCRPAPVACSGAPTCLCVAGPSSGTYCTEGPDGAVTVTTGGG